MVWVTKYNVSNETSFLLLPFTYSVIRSSIDYDNKWIFSRFPHENIPIRLYGHVRSLCWIFSLWWCDILKAMYLLLLAPLPCAEAEGSKTKKKSDRHVSSSIYLPTFMLLSIFFFDEWLFVFIYFYFFYVRFMARNEGMMGKII